VRVISKKKIDEFIKRFLNSRSSFESWYAVVKKATWKSLVDVKTVYSSADQVNRRTVFNISGNNYRLIARINFRTQIVFVLHILTHEEYDGEGWKQ
jgi:mRNA interferase HigB